MARALTLRPSAKINWSLRVGRRNDDGYHDVQTILQSIDVSDTLVFTRRVGPFAMTSRSTDVPVGESNLVWRAARAVWLAAGRAGDPRDAHVKLTKEIPVGAGLGGGSADAAAALVGLNAIWNLKIPSGDLAQLGASLGADVPFFLTGGTAMGVGRGDQIFPLVDVKPLGVVLITPPFGVSTAEAYGWFDADGPAQKPATPGPSVVDGLPVGWPAGPLHIINDLQPPVARRHPLIQEAIDACRAEGAMGAAMTGSGSAVFGVFSLAGAPRAARRLRRREWQVLATRTLTRTQARRRLTL